VEQLTVIDVLIDAKGLPYHRMPFDLVLIPRSLVKEQIVHVGKFLPWLGRDGVAPNAQRLWVPIVVMLVDVPQKVIRGASERPPPLPARIECDACTAARKGVRLQPTKMSLNVFSWIW